MAQLEYKSVFGLELQSNSFQVREGSLETAENIVITQDNIYKKRRGQKDFVDPSPTIVRRLVQYGGKLIGLCNSSVEVYNQGVDGEYSSTTTLTNDVGLTFTISGYPRAIESNGNLYFTTDGGILKLESTTGVVLRAGIAKALDIEIFRQVTMPYEAYFKPDSQVGYKVVFYRKDANQNKIVGSPSQLAIATNPISATSKAYVVAATTATVTSAAHGMSGSLWIYIKNASSIPDGTYYINIVDANTFTLTVPSGTANGTLSWGRYVQNKLRFTTPTNLRTTEYVYQIYRTDSTATADIEPDESTLQLVDEANLVASDLPTSSGGVGFVTYYDTTLDILRQGYLYTNPNTGEGRGAAEANEVPPTATDIELFKNHVFYSNCQTFYRLPFNLLASDSVTMPDGAQFTIKNTSGATTRIFQAYASAIRRNFLSTDVNTGTEQITINAHGFITGDPIIFSTAGVLPTGLVISTVYFVINVSTNVIEVASTYANAIAVTPINLTAAGSGTSTVFSSPKVGNKSVQASNVVSALNLVTVTYNGHGFSTGDFIAVVEAVGATEIQDSVAVRGEYVITVVNQTQFTFVVSGTPAAIASLTFYGTKTAAGVRMFYAGQSDVAGSTGVPTVSIAINDTSRAIVKAINTDASKVNNAFYVSGSDDVPGKMILESTGTTTSFYVNAITSAIIDTFLPSIPTTGVLIAGVRDDEQGVIYVAKLLQPEAAPIYGKISVGTKSSAILRDKALRDSMIVLKKEGAYRINGSSIDTFVATILDSTVSIIASDSVAVLNNQVYCLSQQGVVAVSETAANIVSRPIEPLLTAIFGKIAMGGEATAFGGTAIAGQDLVEANTHAVGYESERLYILSTLSPQSSVTDVVYVYNQITQAWSTRNDLFDHGSIKPADDRLYLIDTENLISRERKNNNLLDFSEGEMSVTVLTTPTTLTATLAVVGGTPEVGDVLVVNNVINQIINIVGSGASAIYTFAAPYSFIVGSTGTIYVSITSTIKTSPIHGGKTTTLKQFSEFQAVYRNVSSLSRLTISFISDSQAGSSETPWVDASSTGGWGNLPWGNFPWGLERGINTDYESGAAQPIRLYLPLEVQRSTWIQCVMVHTAAAEPIMLQSFALTAREYGQRTTK